ncbi:hypothetical protein L195_g016965 [Trifolium pratense]|uniref:Uncharacterized protein n=1 Tax=Trifolium pratense TaxID=57577 RepID=A0A2K3MSM0_TRIPR|nr:hypothetical protein L195_g016965 [Trifolium pratense]
MIEPSSWAKISAYRAGNKINTALEAANQNNDTAIKANVAEEMVFETKTAENGEVLPKMERLPLLPDKKPVKQFARRFAPEIMSKIKMEIERLSKCKFIKTARDLNNATPKDEYHMPVAEMLIDSAAGFEYLIQWQVVADFLVDHSVIEMPQNFVDSEPWKLYFDGSKHKYGTGLEILLDLGAKNISIREFENITRIKNQEANDLTQIASGEAEAYLAISDVHSGACGSHQVGHKMKWLLFR